MTRTIVNIIAIMAVAVLLISGCSGASSSPGDKDTVVSIRNYNFEPGSIEIMAGQTVTWINFDESEHHLVGTNSTWESEQMKPKDKYTKTFDKPGEYEYSCREHSRMKGTVIVK